MPAPINQQCQHVHWINSDGLYTRDAGYLVTLVPEEEYEDCPNEGEVFYDAATCRSCGLVLLFLSTVDQQGYLTALRHVFKQSENQCTQCHIALLNLGERIESQGGGTLHLPLDNKWTIGVLSYLCPQCYRVYFEPQRGEHNPAAPTNRDLLDKHPMVPNWQCTKCLGQDIRSVTPYVHSGSFLVVDANEKAELVEARICRDCEDFTFYVDDISGT